MSRRRLRSRFVRTGPKLVLAAALAISGWAFSNAAVGDPIESVEMPTSAGGEAPLLGEDTVTVMLFFRPDQEHSLTSLKGFADLVEELGDRPVHWVAIASDQHPEDQVQSAIDATGWPHPVLIDRGDTLYGTLGVRLHPVVGIVGKEHRLDSYQPFTKINYLPVVRARVLHALGEIDEAELDRVLNPTKLDRGSDPALAKRNLKFARMLLDAGKPDKALEKVRASLELDPQAAEAHALLGTILAGSDDCPGALAAFEQALALDPSLEEATEGRQRCGSP